MRTSHDNPLRHVAQSHVQPIVLYIEQLHRLVLFLTCRPTFLEELDGFFGSVTSVQVLLCISDRYSSLIASSHLALLMSSMNDCGS